MAIEIAFEHRDPDLRAPGLRKDARAILAAVGRAKAELSLVIVEDVRMRELNREWRGIDRTTDVLSFPAALELPEGVERPEGPEGAEVVGTEGPGADVAGLPDVLGDIVISAPTARRQASRYKRTLEGEMRRLLVHGVLHLLGHDHKKKKEAEVMRAEEHRVLAELRAADARRAG